MNRSNAYTIGSLLCLTGSLPLLFNYLIIFNRILTNHARIGSNVEIFQLRAICAVISRLLLIFHEWYVFLFIGIGILLGVKGLRMRRQVDPKKLPISLSKVIWLGLCSFGA